jgi:hypothetical protein
MFMDRVESGLRGGDAGEPAIEGKLYFRRNKMNKSIQDYPIPVVRTPSRRGSRVLYLHFQNFKS